MRFSRRFPLLLAVALLAATPSFAGSAYELTIAPPAPSGGPTLYRLNVATGAVDFTGGDHFNPTKEQGSIPPGTYRLYVVPAPAGRDGFWLYRLDTQSGRTWSLTNAVWAEIRAK